VLAPSFARARDALAAPLPPAAARALASRGWGGGAGGNGADDAPLLAGPAVPGVSAFRTNVDANDLGDLVPGLTAATRILPAVGYFPSGNKTAGARFEPGKTFHGRDAVRRLVAFVAFGAPEGSAVAARAGALADAMPALAPKSEPLPDAQEVGFVRKAVGDNFHGLVLNPERDVLVLFWLPSCAHCKDFLPVFERVGSRVARARARAPTGPLANLVVAKMDYSANLVAGVKVTAFPALRLWRAGGDQAVGGAVEFPARTRSRDVDSVLSWLEETLGETAKKKDGKKKKKKKKRQKKTKKKKKKQEL